MEELENEKEEKLVNLVWEEIPEYGGISKEVFEGEQINIQNILDKKIAILKFRILPSTFYEGNYLTVQIMDSANNIKWFSTSSVVLEKQLVELDKDGNLPIKAVIRRQKRYYTLSRE